MTRPRNHLARSARVKLIALLDGAIVGKIHHMGNGRLAFEYDAAWRTSHGAYPISLSMPLLASTHGDKVLRAFLWGLLPDNPAVLEWWARRYGVSPYRVVDLLTHVGEDCAGAIQFATPERAHNFIGRPTAEHDTKSIEWLDTANLEHRLRELRLNPAAGRATNDTGQFSLAGAQPKTALYQSADGSWGVPMGRVPTNRILKPPTLGLDDLAYNEHFCLMLARELGLPAAVSSVQHFGTETAIVVERYDRQERSNTLVRVHQEDICQALGVQPSRKYEVDGGPAISDIVDILRQYSSNPEIDLERFIDAIALNWLIGATDAHAKNYSLLHARGPQLRLAPLYDLITILPYPQLNPLKSTLAMQIGGERVISAITGQHWRALARELSVDSDVVLARVADMAGRIPFAVTALVGRTHTDMRSQAVFETLGQHIQRHAVSCAANL